MEQNILKYYLTEDEVLNKFEIENAELLSVNFDVESRNILLHIKKKDMRMFKGFVILTDGKCEEFEFEASKFKAYLTTLHNENFSYVNLGNIHVSKKQMSLIKFTEKVPVNEL